MKYHPNTLAKTINYIGYHAPGDHGLFWDDNGTMPWKEFYWALQQEPGLGFVRASTLRELQHLGYTLPFILDGQVLRLNEGFTNAPYPLVMPPSRLYYACLRRSYQHVRQFGLVSTQRRYLPLASQRELAASIARRRDPQPIPIEIQAVKAHEDRIRFRQAGEYLYLVEALPQEYLIFPPLSTKARGQTGKVEQKDRGHQAAASLAASGSFQLSVEHLRGDRPGDQLTTGKGTSKLAKSGDWKRDARGLRHKRKV